MPSLTASSRTETPKKSSKCCRKISFKVSNNTTRCSVPTCLPKMTFRTQTKPRSTLWSRWLRLVKSPWRIWCQQFKTWLIQGKKCSKKRWKTPRIRSWTNMRNLKASWIWFRKRTIEWKSNINYSKMLCSPKLTLLRRRLSKQKKMLNDRRKWLGPKSSLEHAPLSVESWPCAVVFQSLVNSSLLVASLTSLLVESLLLALLLSLRMPWRRVQITCRNTVMLNKSSKRC